MGIVGDDALYNLMFFLLFRILTISQVTCTVSGMDSMSTIHVVKRKEDFQTIMVVIDNGDIIKHPFWQPSRYSVHFQLTCDVGTVSIHYRGI